MQSAGGCFGVPQTGARALWSQPMAWTTWGVCGAVERGWGTKPEGDRVLWDGERRVRCSGALETWGAREQRRVQGP